MTTPYQPEQLPQLIEQTEHALQQLEDMNKPGKNKPYNFFQTSSDRQIELAERQLQKIQQHLQKLEQLQDQYFTAALSTQAVAMDKQQPIRYDDMQALRGRVEANMIMIEKLITQKTVGDLNGIRFLANQLTAQKKSHDQLTSMLGKFVEHHSTVSVNNEKRLEALHNRAEKLYDLLPKPAPQQAHAVATP